MNLAIYSFDKQLWEESVFALTKLIKLKAHVATSYMFRGRANAFLSRWDEALDDLTRAIQLNPARSDFFLYRGCLLKDRNAAKAIEDFSVSILLNDSAENHAAYYERGKKIKFAYFCLAQLYYTQQKYELAVVDFLAAIEMNPGQATAYLSLGQIFLKHLKDYRMAYDCFSKCIACDANQLKAYLCRADLYQKMYMNGVHLDILFEDKEDTFVGKTKMNSYFERAIRDYSKCIHMSPGNYLFYLYRGRLLLKQGYTHLLLKHKNDERVNK